MKPIVLLSCPVKVVHDVINTSLQGKGMLWARSVLAGRQWNSRADIVAEGYFSVARKFCSPYLFVRHCGILTGITFLLI